MARTSFRLAFFVAVPVVLLAACSSDSGDDDPGAGTSGGETSASSGSGIASSSGTVGSSSSGQSGSSSGTASSSSGSSSGETSSSSGQEPATCTDTIKNGDESDVDCGLACNNKCVPGKTCNGNADCAERICTAGVCAEPTENDLVKNGTETDVDCGGPGVRKCSFPKKCVEATDCVSDLCDAATLKCTATYLDGVKNLDETDIDCGGPGPALRCAPGRFCNAFTDCASGGNCVGHVCQTPAFNDSFQNQGETDVDCGGAAPNQCGNGQKCELQTDCGGVTFCNTSAAQPLCTVPVPGDAFTNGTETDLNCGGSPAIPACADGRGCKVGTDCDSRVCVAGAPTAQGAMPAGDVGTRRCKEPASTDGIQNGNETDTDCGGAGNPKCAEGKSCALATDCASDGCHSGKKICVKRRSCARTYGGDTCGATENGGDDCCATIDVQRPTKPKVALGKYKVTAGRMREFIERVNGNVKGYIAGLNLPLNRWNGAAWDKWLPANLDDVAARFGPNAIADEWEAGNTSGARGCQVSVGGGRAYWFNAGDGEGAGAIPNNEVGKYSHDALDQKVMSCLMPAVAAAFCIWDGGELADPDDLKMAWNNSATAAGVVNNARKYPWGDLPLPPTTRGGNEQACKDSNCNAYIVHMWNYLYPDYRTPDSSAIIPAPGRRPLGAGPLGHMDLAGAGFEYTKRTPAAGTSTLQTFNNGSFEGHVPATYGQQYDNNATLNRRYYAFTAGRCSYPPAP